MSSTKKNPALLYLGRFQCDYFPEGGTQSFRFPFTPGVIRDLEVFDIPQLLVQIKAFVAYFKIVPSELTILLADDILFSKSFTLPDLSSREDAIATFVDSVPFEETAVVRVPFQNSVTVSVANKSYYEAFKKGFEELGFEVELVLPSFLLSKEVNLAKSLNASSLALALRHATTHKQYSLLNHSVNSSMVSSASGSATKPKSNQRVLLLIGVLIILLGILVIVFMLSNQQPLTPSQNSTIQPELVDSESVVSQDIAVKSLLLISSPNSVARVDQILVRLQELGINNVSSESSTTIASTSGSTLLFSSVVPEEGRERLVTELQKIIPSITVSEGETASFEAVFTLYE